MSLRTRRPRRCFGLVAGGGTAGHVLPALAIAEELEARGLGPVELVGSRRGLERTLDDGPRRWTLLPGRGIARSLAPRAVVANLRALLGLAAAGMAAVVLVGRTRPAVVVAVGGYASVPTALAAVLLGVPVVLCNVDAVPGAANRLLGRFARACAVAWDPTSLPRAVWTGAPVRSAICAVRPFGNEERLEARRELGLPATGRVVAAFGGSLGARTVNDAVVALARRFEGRDDVAVYHVVGARDAQLVAAAASGIAGLRVETHERLEERPAGPARYVQVPYERRMGLLYRAADVAVCRAGAMTVAELAVVGLPAVLVPLPGAPGDHQTKNAERLVEAGAAVMVPDERCDAERLEGELRRLLDDAGRLEAMAQAGLALARPNAAATVAALAVAHAAPRRARADSTGVRESVPVSAPGPVVVGGRTDDVVGTAR